MTVSSITSQADKEYSLVEEWLEEKAKKVFTG
jgi:hypothetical protein